MQHQNGASRIAGDPGGSRVWFCSMPFDIIGSTEVLAMLATRPSGDPFAYVTTPNVDHVVRLGRHEASLLPLYQDAWMTVCDSRILAALSAITGDRLPVTTGSDLTEALLRKVIAPSDPINVVGADADVVLRLRAMFKLNQISHFMPPMGLNERPDEIERCVDFIERRPARFTFLAVGAPQQEKIAHAAQARGTVTGIGLCIGTSLQFSTGVVSRAPLWVQRLRLEWLHRLIQDPRRLARRYLVDDMMIFPMFSRHMLMVLAAKGRQARTR